MREHQPPDGPILIGISSCLLGEKVRFDAGHKKDRFVTDVLGRHFSWVPICPELEVGMGVPREPVRLVGAPDHPIMVGTKSETDWTSRMNAYCLGKVDRISSLDLSGYILKSNSPSCGMERVRVYAKNGIPAKTGRGLFARVLMEKLPLLPVEEEGRLNDPRIRENFIVRVFSFHRYQQLLKNYSRHALVEFHAAHKYLMLAHSPRHYNELGRLVARQKSLPPSDLKERYGKVLMEGLAIRSTTKKNTNVLHHILGFLHESLTREDREDILRVVEDYRNELIPLVVPLTLISHYVRKHRIQYIAQQVYLSPHPREMMLLNHV